VVEGKKSPCIIVDDLSTLVFSGVPAAEVVQLTNYLHQLAAKVPSFSLLKDESAIKTRYFYSSQFR